MFLTRWSGSAAFCIVFLCAMLVGTTVHAGTRLPSGHELLFMSYHDVNPDVFIMDVDRKLTLNLTRSSAFDGSPVWSPDGDWIAFVSDRERGLNIYVMDARGRNLRRLTNGEAAFDAPRWSADGQRLVFFARGGTQELFGVNFDGSDFQQLTSATQPVTGILLDLGIEQSGSVTRVFSPDRTQMPRIGVEGQEWVVYLSGGDDTFDERILMTLGRGYTEPPVWSPDGEQVAFVASSVGRNDLYMVRIADGSIHQLTRTRAIESSPVWRP